MRYARSVAIGVIAAGVLAGNLLAADPRPARATPTPPPAKTTGQGVRLTSATSQNELPTPAGPALGAPNILPRATTNAVERLPSVHSRMDITVASQMDDAQTFPIDLPTALRLADAANLQVAFAREQINLAMAQVDAAKALWLPTVQGGASYNRHEGAIQRIEGAQIITSRGGYDAGLGAGVYGTTSPQIQGLYASFDLADAFFQPLAARRFASSRDRAAVAVTNDMLLQVSLGYFELLRSGEDAAISLATQDDSKHLVDLTTAFAETGEGLHADANRVRADLTLRVNDVRRAREAQRVASARLAQLLRLDPQVSLRPADSQIMPLEIVPGDAPLKELVIQSLAARPELAENRELVEQAVVRMRRERVAVLMPSIIMGGSYLGLGAGVNEQLAPFHDRFDFDAIAYWKVRNLGFGEAAARRSAQSNVRASQFRQLAMMDQVAREVVEAYYQVQARRDQIATARLGVEVALDSQRQNIDRIEQAKGLPIEVLQSIQALAQARREYLRTIYEYNVAQFTLYRATGWPAKEPATALQTTTPLPR